MLSRKTSNALFYGTLIIILAVVLLIRFVTLGTLNAKIDDVTNSNRNLQTQIEELEELVQENKDTQTDHLYELYRSVPPIYDEVDLENYTYAQLDLVGISDEEITLRDADAYDDITFPVSSIFTELQSTFKVVEVQVYFNVAPEEIIKVDLFIDKLYESGQVFIVSSIEYETSEDASLIGIAVNFLAFYELEKES